MAMTTRPTWQYRRPSAASPSHSILANSYANEVWMESTYNQHFNTTIQRPEGAQTMPRKARTLPAGGLSARVGSFDNDKSFSFNASPAGFRARSNSLPEHGLLRRTRASTAEEVRVKVYLEESKRHRQADIQPLIFSFPVELGTSYRDFTNKLRHKAKTLYRNENDEDFFGIIPLLVSDDGPMKEDGAFERLIRKCWAQGYHYCSRVV